MHVFISHSRENSSTALQLCDALRQLGVETWLDVRDLEPGRQWDDAVIAAIRDASGFVFLIGPPGPEERWQTFEWQQVVNSDRYLDPATPLIPVLIGHPRVPGFLKSRRAIEITDPALVAEAAGQIADLLRDPAQSVDQEKLAKGRRALEEARENLRQYSRTLEEEDVRQAPLRALE